MADVYVLIICCIGGTDWGFDQVATGILKKLQYTWQCDYEVSVKYWPSIDKVLVKYELVL